MRVRDSTNAIKAKVSSKELKNSFLVPNGKKDTVIFQSKGSNPKPHQKHISPLTYPEKEVTVES